MSRDIEHKIVHGPTERRGLGGLGDLVRPAATGSPTTPTSSNPGSGTPAPGGGASGKLPRNR
jgi:hypothetical protein